MIDDRLFSIVYGLFPSMKSTGKTIFDHPETGLSEYKASKWLSEYPPQAHTVEYGEMCNSDRAYEGLKKNVIALASLGYDLLTDNHFCDSVFQEYNRMVPG